MQRRNLQLAWPADLPPLKGYVPWRKDVMISASTGLISSQILARRLKPPPTGVPNGSAPLPLKSVQALGLLQTRWWCYLNYATHSS